MSFSVPPQHQTNPAKAPGLIVTPVGVKHDITLGDYIKRMETPTRFGDPTALYDRGWNDALKMIAKLLDKEKK